MCKKCDWLSSVIDTSRCVLPYGLGDLDVPRHESYDHANCTGHDVGLRGIFLCVDEGVEYPVIRFATVEPAGAEALRRLVDWR